MKTLHKSLSANRKRLDAEIKVSPFWGDDYQISLRILARESIVEEAEESLLEEVIKNKKKWQQGKKNRFLHLTGIPGTAYILKEETVEA